MRILINDTMDLKRDFSTTALEGHLSSIITPPVLKPFSKTEWADQHGMDYDVSNPVLNARTLSMPFYCTSELNYQKLVSYLELNIVNKWYFEAINRSYTLRLTGSSKVVHHTEKWWFTLTFSEDIPTVEHVNALPRIHRKAGFTMDGVDFGNFGFSFLERHVQEILKPFPVKQNLRISSSHTTGLEYPDKNTYYANKQVKLPLFCKGADVLQKLDLLVWKLTQPGFREFDEIETGNWYKFIYRRIDVVEFIPEEWLKITLNLEFQETDIFDVLVDDYGNFLVDDNNKTLSKIL